MKVLFMPGASGDPAFWEPVADRLPAAWQKTMLGWPGLGNQPSAPDVNGWDDLYGRVEQAIDGTAALVAQSMGGMLAMRAALNRPHSVSHLVLTATSAGVDLRRFDVHDWREEYRTSYPNAPAWVYDRPPGLEPDLGRIKIPVLLIWARGDRISPPAVGRHLAEILPNARFIEVDDDSHMFARSRSDEVGQLIAEHLAA